MKKLFNRRTVPILVVAAILVACFGYVRSNQGLWGATAKTDAKPAAVQAAPLKLADGAADNSRITKNETVYVKLTSAGEVKDTTVVNWLHFAGEVPGEVVDPVQLSQLKAMNGAFRLKNDPQGVVISNLDANQHNVYYSGSSDQKLPVEVAVDYYLDGKKINPGELAGKSGQVRMVFRLDNQLAQHVNIAYARADGAPAAAGKEIYTPLAAMISLELPADRFSEVRTEEGIVTAVGETMKVNYILFPYPSTSASITMTADNFKLDGIDIAVQPHMPPLPDLSSADKLQELQQGLGKLDQAMAGLESGSSDLAGGQGKLVAGLQALQGGTGQLILLNQAEEKIAQGVLLINGLMIEGVKPLAEAPGAADQVKSLYAALQKQNELLTTLVKGGKLEGNDLPPISTAAAGLAQARDGLDKLVAGGRQSQAGLESLHQGVVDIRRQGVAPLEQGVAASLNEARIGQGQIKYMEQAVKNYDSFLGKPAGSRSRVQFIYQCESIK